MGSVVDFLSIDKCHILEARQYQRRLPPFTAGWNKIRLGVMMDITTVASDNGALWSSVATDITEPYNSELDLTCFGLKDVATLAMPGQAGCQYWGLLNPAATATRLYADVSPVVVGVTGASSYQNAWGVASGTTVNRATQSAASSYGLCCLRGGLRADGAGCVSTNYAGFAGLEIELLDRGLSTQRVNFRCSTEGGLEDTSRSALRALLNTFPNPTSHASAIAANNGATAFEVPTHFFFRLPFNAYRAKVYDWMPLQIS